MEMIRHVLFSKDIHFCHTFNGAPLAACQSCIGGKYELHLHGLLLQHWFHIISSYRYLFFIYSVFLTVFNRQAIKSDTDIHAQINSNYSKIQM